MLRLVTWWSCHAIDWSSPEPSLRLRFLLWLFFNLILLPVNWLFLLGFWLWFFFLDFLFNFFDYNWFWFGLLLRFKCVIFLLLFFFFYLFFDIFKQEFLYRPISCSFVFSIL